MDGERERTEGGLDLPMPDPEPSCAACARFVQFVEMVVALLGRTRQELNAALQRISELEAQVAELNRTQFGRKSEVQPPPKPKEPEPPEPEEPEEPTDSPEPEPPPADGDTPEPPPEREKRRRGRQPGSRTPPRRKRPELPVQRERRELPEEERCCPQCGAPYRAAGIERSTVLEIGWDVVRREIERVRYRPTCQCPEARGVTAPPEPRLMLHTQLGVSVWMMALVQVFGFFRTQARLVRDWDAAGLDLAVSVLSEGLRRLQPLFDAWIAELDRYQAEATVLQADETSWRVQPLGPDDGPARHWLWVLLTKGAVRFRVLKTRSAVDAQVLLGAAARDGPRIVVCDRWSAYKALAKACGGLLQLAFCWAHQRRDFRRVGTGFAGLLEWSEDWLDAIGTLFWLAAQRQEAWDPQRPLERQGAQFQTRQGDLERVVQGLFDRARKELEEFAEQLKAASGHAWAELNAQGKALRSLLNHEEGLRVFVQRPEVPPDNNAAERAIRGPVIQRYTSFGSGSPSGALLTEQMYSLIATLHQWDLNPYHWMQDYLEACARNEREAPADLGPWLPWRMDAARRAELSRPLPSRTAAAASGEPPEASVALAA